MDILQKTEKFVKELLIYQLPINRIFHNLEHTENVVHATEMLCRKLNVINLEKELVLLAAWFHDTGHIYNYEGHEEKSQQIAESFLKKNYYSIEKIERVLTIIGATQMPQVPTNFLEKIICDADLYHLTIPEYCEYQQKLKEEIMLVSNKTFAKKEWEELNIQFLKKHKYFTSYGQKVFSKMKNKNLKYCETKLRDSQNIK